MPLCEKPLFSWSVDASLASEYIDWTLISSNCPMIQRETLRLYSTHPKRFNLRFVQRPDEICQDNSPTEDALIHSVEFAKVFLNFECDYILLLQPTSPIRDNRLVDRCIEQFVKDDADSLFTASRHTPFYFRQKDDQVIADWDIKNRPMRQEIKEWVWHDDGNVYISKKELLLSENCRLGGKMSMMELTKRQALQIDDEDDFKIIEAMMGK